MADSEFRQLRSRIAELEGQLQETQILNHQLQSSLSSAQSLQFDLRALAEERLRELQQCESMKARLQTQYDKLSDEYEELLERGYRVGDSSSMRHQLNLRGSQVIAPLSSKPETEDQWVQTTECGSGGRQELLEEIEALRAECSRLQSNRLGELDGATGRLRRGSDASCTTDSGDLRSDSGYSGEQQQQQDGYDARPFVPPPPLSLRLVLPPAVQESCDDAARDLSSTYEESGGGWATGRLRVDQPLQLTQLLAGSTQISATRRFGAQPTPRIDMPSGIRMTSSVVLPTPRMQTQQGLGLHLNPNSFAGQPPQQSLLTPRLEQLAARVERTILPTPRERHNSVGVVPDGQTRRRGVSRMMGQPQVEEGRRNADTDELLPLNAPAEVAQPSQNLLETAPTDLEATQKHNTSAENLVAPSTIASATVPQYSVPPSTSGPCSESRPQPTPKRTETDSVLGSSPAHLAAAPEGNIQFSSHDDPEMRHSIGQQPTDSRSVVSPVAAAASRTPPASMTMEDASMPTARVFLDDGESSRKVGMFSIDLDLSDASRCPICELMALLKERFQANMVNRQLYYAAGWLPEMCERWMLEHEFLWTIEERSCIASALWSRPPLSKFRFYHLATPARYWRHKDAKKFWKSNWKDCFLLLQGVFLYIFSSAAGTERVVTVSLIRSAKITVQRNQDKMFVLRLDCLGCGHCVGATEDQHLQEVVLAFKDESTMMEWKETMTKLGATCPHVCSSKFANSLTAFREICEDLIASSLREERRQAAKAALAAGAASSTRSQK